MKKASIFIIALIVIIICIILLGYKLMFTRVSNSNAEKEIIIPIGTGTNGIATLLKENRIIRSKLGFKIYVKINKISNFQAGTYKLKENMT